MKQNQSNHPRQPRPYNGWALGAALTLDEAYPGLLAHTFQGSNLARQVRFAVFAAIKANPPEAVADRLRAVAPADLNPSTVEPLKQIARCLLELRPRRILEGVFGSCPEGLVGLLARLGPDPISFDPAIYRLAWTLFADPQHRQRAKLLRETPGTITAARIRTVSYLDGILLCRAVFDRVSNPGEVVSLKEAVCLIQTLVPDASDDRLGQSLNALGPYGGSRRAQTQGLAAWALGWLRRMRNSPITGPFADDDRDFRLLIGKALADAGRRYRNCVGDHLGHVAVGRRLYYEWVNAPGAIIELHCLSDGRERTFYSTGQIRGIGNSKPPVEVLNAIRARLRQAGVLFAGAYTGQRASLNGLLSIYEDEEPSDTYVGFLNDLAELPEPVPTRAA